MPIVRCIVFVVMVLDDRCSGYSRVFRNSVAWGNTNFDPSPGPLKYIIVLLLKIKFRDIYLIHNIMLKYYNIM